MKSKKLLIVSLLVVIMLVVLSVSNSVFAAAQGYDPETWTSDTSSATKMKDMVSKILGFVQVLGSAIAVIMIIVIGIKYMLGSAEEKADYKKTLLPYVIGAGCIFAASNIASIVYSFFTTT